MHSFKADNESSRDWIWKPRNRRVTSAAAYGTHRERKGGNAAISHRYMLFKINRKIQYCCPLKYNAMIQRLLKSFILSGVLLSYH